MGKRARLGVRLRRNRPAVSLLLALVPALAAGSWGLARFQDPPEADAAEYLGREVCANCHEDRANQHAASNFFGSWLPARMLSQLKFDRSVREGDIQYTIEQTGDSWVFSVQLPGRPAQRLPIHSVVGGERFGHSLLLEVDRIESRPLTRSTLIEARYFIEAGTGRLKLSPGFPQERPGDYQTALGRVLSPSFAEKCLDCHGGIRDPELAAKGGPHPAFLDTGVGCERCHGPGGRHLEALETGGDDLGIVNPRRLRHSQVLELCGRCHTGFSAMSQPLPEDLLISNQVNALARSQCYIQSSEGLSCISCHDPHRNARVDDPVYNQACAQCHAGNSAQAVACSAQPEGNCVQCHMPVVDRPGNFHLRDHWIRVLPEKTPPTSR